MKAHYIIKKHLRKYKGSLDVLFLVYTYTRANSPCVVALLNQLQKRPSRAGEFLLIQQNIQARSRWDWDQSMKLMDDRVTTHTADVE